MNKARASDGPRTRNPFTCDFATTCSFYSITSNYSHLKRWRLFQHHHSKVFSHSFLSGISTVARLPHFTVENAAAVLPIAVRYEKCARSVYLTRPRLSGLLLDSDGTRTLYGVEMILSSLSRTFLLSSFFVRHGQDTSRELSSSSQSCYSKENGSPYNSTSDEYIPSLALVPWLPGLAWR